MQAKVYHEVVYNQESWYYSADWEVKPFVNEEGGSEVWWSTVPYNQCGTLRVLILIKAWFITNKGAICEDTYAGMVSLILRVTFTQQYHQEVHNRKKLVYKRPLPPYATFDILRYDKHTIRKLSKNDDARHVIDLLEPSFLVLLVEVLLVNFQREATNAVLYLRH